MKTNAFKYLGIALMALMMISLTSCEVEIDSFYDDDNIDVYKRQVWRCDYAGIGTEGNGKVPRFGFDSYGRA